MSDKQSRKLLVAWTAETYQGDYPPFVNVTQVDSMTEITIRAPVKADGSPGEAIHFQANVWLTSKIGALLTEAGNKFETGMDTLPVDF